MMISGNETDQQLAAIRAKKGRWLVAAGAGSGKTGVVTKRFVQLLRDGDAGIDEILTITFTKKAAGHMMQKIRELLSRNGMTEERRSIDRARISTIHGFCANVVRSRALALGLDPGFKVTDEDQAFIIKQEAFNAAVESLTATQGRHAINLIAAYEPNRSQALFKAILGIHSELRCRGQENPAFPIPVPDLQTLRSALREEINLTLQMIEDLGGNPTRAIGKMEALLEATVEDDAGKALELLEANKPGKSGKAKEGIVRVNKAREALANAYYFIAATPDLEIMRELLKRFDDEYATRKRKRSLLDFEDLELFTFKLLDENEAACEALAGSFKFIMVDEFQDTNDLQCRIIDKLDRGNVFFVGDVNQSIYRFRNADVRLFEQKKSGLPAENVLPLPRNFRSQAEILRFIDHLFLQDQMLAPENYIKLEPGADQFPREEPCRVDVILVDGESKVKDKANADLARSAEGTLIARRLHDLKQQGIFDYGDMAILLRASTGVEHYRDALDRAGIPNYVSIGRAYYQKLEFGDALCLLRLLVNPLNDLALLSVLRSPMAGVSDDTLYWLRRIAGKDRSDLGRPLWPAIMSKELEGEIPPEEHSKLARFARDYQDMRRRSRRRSLEATMREVIGYNNYSASVAAGDGGRQAYANLLKLVDKAFEFEQAEGRDLAAFVSFLEHQQAEEAAENEAPVEEEKGSGAVRILTIHGAKGLEFPLVVWANMGYAPDQTNAVLLCRGEERKDVGFKHKTLGNDSRKLFANKNLWEEEVALDLEEEKRIGYVAMTRAQRHLILCGTANIDKPSEGAAGRKPIEWVRTLFGLEPGNRSFEQQAEAASKGEGFHHVFLDSLEDVATGFTLCTDPKAVVEESEERLGPQPDEPIAPVRSDLEEFPRPASFVPARVDASSLDTYLAAPCRFYLENILQMGALLTDEEATLTPEEKGTQAGSMHVTGPQAEGPHATGNLERHEIGTLVHAVLEHELQALEQVGNKRLDSLARRELGEDAVLAAEDHELARRLLDNFKTLPVARELLASAEAGELMRETGFSLLAGQTIIRGKIDAIYRRGDRLVVVDYKTGMVSGEETAEKKADQHKAQMMCYALAARNMGASEVEIVLPFLDRPGMEYRSIYSMDELDGIQEEVEDLLESMEFLLFRELESSNPLYCSQCAGNKGKAPLCAAGPSRTLEL